MHISSVRFKPKKQNKTEFINYLKTFKTSNYKGCKRPLVIDAGERMMSFVEWENENCLSAERENLIKFLDGCRHMLEELSPELGVTDPISGPLIIENNLK